MHLDLRRTRLPPCQVWPRSCPRADWVASTSFWRWTTSAAPALA